MTDNSQTAAAPVELTALAKAYNVESEDEFSMEGQFMDFREAASTLIVARQVLEEIVVGLEKLHEYGATEEEDADRMYRLFQAGLERVISDLERITPKNNPCKVLLYDIGEQASRELEHRKEIAKNAKRHLDAVEKNRARLMFISDGAGEEVHRLRAEIAQKLKERNLLRDELEHLQEAGPGADREA